MVYLCSNDAENVEWTQSELLNKRPTYNFMTLSSFNQTNSSSSDDEEH